MLWRRATCWFWASLAGAWSNCSWLTRAGTGATGIQAAGSIGTAHRLAGRTERRADRAPGGPARLRGPSAAAPGLDLPDVGWIG